MKILWICGWASDLRPWLGLIKSKLSGDHQIVSFDEWFGQNQKYQADRTILWSLGYKARIQVQGPCLALAPAIHFCGPLGWKTRILDRMIQQFQKSPEAVLLDFARRMGIPDSDQNLWIQRALQMPTSLLCQGLEALKEDYSGYPAPDLLIYGQEDQICAPALFQELSLPNMQSCADAAHWPLSEPYFTLLRDWIQHDPA